MDQVYRLLDPEGTHLVLRTEDHRARLTAVSHLQTDLADGTPWRDRRPPEVEDIGIPQDRACLAVDMVPQAGLGTTYSDRSPL
jgi:hypothetical protein